jgi:RNA-directed DNA polymerase
MGREWRTGQDGVSEALHKGKPAATDRCPLPPLNHSFTLDCNIYVRSQQAGQRVMTSVTRFLTRRRKLKVNEAKSAVARPEERKFLGFSISSRKEPKRRIAPKVLLRCKQKIRELTQRTRGISLEQMMKELTAYLRGWKSYFGFCQTPSLLKALEEWIRRRLRSRIWKQWKRGNQRYAKLRHLGIGRDLPHKRRAAHTALGIWRTARLCLTRFLLLTSIRLVSLACSLAMRNPLNRRMRTRMSGGVAGADG